MIRVRNKMPPTGHFASRAELTGHVWAIARQQIFPNRRSIADACGISLEHVDAILRSKEGLQDYLSNGCLSGGEPAASSRSPDRADRPCAARPARPAHARPS